MVSLIDEVAREIVDKQVDCFVERNMSRLMRKSPDEIIKMWLDWQFSRYVVDEQADAFYVNDLKNKTIVACITKKDPQAYQHAYKIRDDLNSGDCEGSIQLTGHFALDELIKTLDDDTECPTINDAINDLIEDDDEQEKY